MWLAAISLKASTSSLVDHLVKVEDMEWHHSDSGKLLATDSVSRTSKGRLSVMVEIHFSLLLGAGLTRSLRVDTNYC